MHLNYGLILILSDFSLLFQTLMSVQLEVMTVIQMPPVPILLEASHVHAILGTLEMETPAQVITMSVTSHREWSLVLYFHYGYSLLD